MVPGIKLEDCKGMLDYLFLETWDGTERLSREFRAPGADRKTKSATQWTPRKYTFGELELRCTCEGLFFCLVFLFAGCFCLRDAMVFFSSLSQTQLFQ